MHTYPQALMEGDTQMSPGPDYENGSGYEQQYGDSPAPRRPRSEKLNSVLIVTIGFFALIIGGTIMAVNLSNPFSDIIKQGQERERLLAEQKEAELAAARSRDTDGDGLSDYDEINTSKTSPYLKDSDSDGYDDKAEIAMKTDPNCPEGQNCFSSSGEATTTGSVPLAQTSISNPTISITPDYIRQLMRQNGATDAQISSLTDDELMAAYKSYLEANPEVAASLASQGISTDISASGQSPSLSQPNTGNVDLKSLGVSSVQDLQNLTGAQIRQLMIQAGASASILASVTDDQLKAMFVAQLQNNSQTQ